MKLGFIGLGQMGKQMVLNLAEKGHRVITFDADATQYPEVEKRGAITVSSLKELAEKIEPPRTIWIMIPAGKAVDILLKDILSLLTKGDTLIEGGSSLPKDSQRRAKLCAEKEVSYLDCGVVGSPSTASLGLSLLIGGDAEAFKRNELLFKELSNKDNYAFVGNSGAGHFARMVQKGMEYGVAGSLAEGLETLYHHRTEMQINLHEIARIYARGTLLEGKTMSLIEQGLHRGDFEALSGTLPQTSEEDYLKELDKLNSVTLLKEARLLRSRTRKKPRYAGKIIKLLKPENE
jgi:6-phosphogluconate dehydrogenase